MPSGSPLPAAASTHKPGLAGPAFESGMSIRLARLLGLPATNVPMTRTGGLSSRFGRHTVNVFPGGGANRKVTCELRWSARTSYRRVLTEANENFVNSRAPRGYLRVVS